MFDRWDICEAYTLYDLLWNPTEYASRLRRMNYRARHNLSLESANENVKAIYGRLVREHNRLYVAYDRYQRRNSKAERWPGTASMRGGAGEWLRRKGLLDAISCYA